MENHKHILDEDEFTCFTCNKTLEQLTKEGVKQEDIGVAVTDDYLLKLAKEMNIELENYNIIKGEE